MQMSNEIQYTLYSIDSEDIKVKVAIKDESIWVTQRGMAELFGCTSDNISLHLKNIYADGELSEISTTEDFSVVQSEGSRQVTRSVRFYNLDAIISVGYRVNSRRATQFRIWATSVLKEFIKKGFIVLPATIMLTYAEQALLRVRSPACPYSACSAYKNPYSSNLFCKEFKKSFNSLSCGRRISANQSASAKAA